MRREGRNMFVLAATTPLIAVTLILGWVQPQPISAFAPPTLSRVDSSYSGSSSLFAITRHRTRDWFLRRLGRRPKLQQPLSTVHDITTLAQLDAHWEDKDGLFVSTKTGKTDYTALLRAASVIGDTQIIGTPNYTHPVAQLLHERQRKLKLSMNNASAKDDGCKVALAVEGGGMRGCVSAGMICAVHHLNLTNAIDCVYGSSAGSIVSAYLITGQLPWFGPELYYDRLTTAGRKFIDPRRLLRALGLGLLDPRLFKDVVMRQSNGGKPVLNLNYLTSSVQETKPLDWDTFVERQKVMPLNVVASGLKSERSVVLNMANGGFSTLAELTDCMHASCLLPGIAGPVMNMDTRVVKGLVKDSPKYVIGNNLKGDYYEPLADALVYEPLPYRTAVERDGVTHCVVIRSMPDGIDVTRKGGLFESMITKRFFLRKNNLPKMYQRMRMHLHKKLYAEDVIRLNHAARSTRNYRDTASQEPHLMAIAVPPGSPEVTRLEVGREAIFAGLRRGFARAYDCLVENPAERGRGEEVACQFFPDEIMDYDPLDFDVTDESAFARYMKRSGVHPRSWTAADAQQQIKQQKGETAAHLETQPPPPQETPTSSTNLTQ